VRESDGMVFGSVMQNRCIFMPNADPNEAAEIRLFIDRDHAIRYLKEQCAPRVAKLVYEELEFDSREGDSRLIMPNSPLPGRPH
jgi:hypothetical protein